MARPKLDFPPAPTVLALANEKRHFTIRATPGARKEGITISDGVLIVKVRAKPQDGSANAAVVRLLAAALDVPVSRLSIIHGTTGRNKVIALAD